MAQSFFMTIDGEQVAANHGEYVLAVARRADRNIPTLCHHPAVEPFGSCRLCLVEVTKASWQGWKGLMTACLYPAAPDLIVETDSPRVRLVRRNILDLLLARCPQSQVIRDLAAQYGVTKTSFEKREKFDDCILCGLCTRICETVATSAISTVNRGREREIGSPWHDLPADCLGCLACAHLCPTGHIKFVEQDGQRRIWDREFSLIACVECGKTMPLTSAQAAFLVEKQRLAANYFSCCEECQRHAAANKFGELARWKKISLEQDKTQEASL